MGSSGGSSLGGFSFGGKNPFATDAAAAKLRDEFARMRKRTSGAINEDVSARGIFSSGVASANMNDAMTQLDLQEGAGLESLFNNAEQQRMAWQMEQERMKMDQQRALAGGGCASGTYQGGNQTGGVTGVGFQSGTYKGGNSGGNSGGGVSGGASGVGASGVGGAAAPSRRDSSSEFYRTYGKWPSPGELDAFMGGGMGAYNPNTDQSMALPGTSVFG